MMWYFRFQQYQQISKHDIEKAIQLEFSGDIEDALLTVVRCVKNRPGFFAERLYKSMKVKQHSQCDVSTFTFPSLPRRQICVTPVWHDGPRSSPASIAPRRGPIGFAALDFTAYEPNWTQTNLTTPGYTKPAGLIESCNVTGVHHYHSLLLFLNSLEVCLRNMCDISTRSLSTLNAEVYRNMYLFF